MSRLVPISGEADAMVVTWPNLWARLQVALDPLLRGIVPNCGHGVDAVVWTCAVPSPVGSRILCSPCSDRHVRAHVDGLPTCLECGERPAKVHRGDLARYEWESLDGRDLELRVVCLWLCADCNRGEE